MLTGVKFDLYVTTTFRGNPATDENWTSDAQWKDKRLGVNLGIYTYHSFTDRDTGEKTYNYQIVFSSINSGNLVWLDRPAV